MSASFSLGAASCPADFIYSSMAFETYPIIPPFLSI